AVRQTLPHIRDWRTNTVLILSGDHLYRMDYRKFLARHYETQADVTVSVVPFVREAAEEFGLLKADPTGHILEFREKPKGEALEEMRVDTTAFGLSPEEAARRPFLASMGIYVFNYERLRELLAANPTWLDFGREIIPAAIKDYNVQSYLFDDYWEDIGTISAFHAANLDMTATLPKFNFFDTDAPIYTRARYLPPSKLNNCQINNTIISDGCILNRAVVNRSLIGLRTRIDFGANVENSYLMGADFYQSLEELEADAAAGRPHIGIGEGSIIRNAIVDKNTRIGAGVRLVNERGVREFDAPDGSYYIRDGIILVTKNATIKDGVVV
ncbi:MAG TPA: sugar phosphate nucleotidyltransferase, partial [Pyrinomonadaceae bacterium]|nr:sugar phosphate nucleotidyltransferase [Pyrinomonadaceae bacterium]